MAKITICNECGKDLRCSNEDISLKCRLHFIHPEPPCEAYMNKGDFDFCSMKCLVLWANNQLEPTERRLELSVFSMLYETPPMSRSQARKIYNSFTNYKKITLDFARINNIGRGFAHELFVVFQKDNPDIELKIINATQDILDTIENVQNTESID